MKTQTVKPDFFVLDLDEEYKIMETYDRTKNMK